MTIESILHRPRGAPGFISLPTFSSIRSCIVVGAIVVAWLSAGQSGPSSSAHAQAAPDIAGCGQWDSAATEALVSLVRGQQDSELRKVGDAVFRIRRARRNCAMGWVRLACQDYRAIVTGAPGFGFAPDAKVHCPSVIASAAASTMDGLVISRSPLPAAISPPSLQGDCANVAAYPPLDHALGNAGGDPHAYYVFNREDDLAAGKQAADACASPTFVFAQQ